MQHSTRKSVTKPSLTIMVTVSYSPEMIKGSCRVFFFSYDLQYLDLLQPSKGIVTANFLGMA